MKPPIYLDNNATTPLSPLVREAMMPYFEGDFGNPSSLHRFGVVAERALKTARFELAQYFQAKDHEMIFTSGGTESINLGIKGVARALKRKGKHIISAPTEHEAVLASLQQLVSEGFEVSFAPVESDGRVLVQSMINLIRPDTILIALMHVNNELGTIHPIEAFARQIKSQYPTIRIFVDGVQAFGKKRLGEVNVDLYALSAHKLHGPKGVGALYVKEGTPIQALISGGGQEGGLRSGTENVAGIVGLAKAAALAYENLLATESHWQTLKSNFIQQLLSLENVVIHSPADGLPNTINASFMGVPSEIMMHALTEKNIYVSAGSACSGAKRKPSHVLKAIGLPENQIQSAIRFSLSRNQTPEEMNEVFQAIQTVFKNLKNVIKKT